MVRAVKPHRPECYGIDGWGGETRVRCGTPLCGLRGGSYVRRPIWGTLRRPEPPAALRTAIILGYLRASGAGEWLPRVLGHGIGSVRLAVAEALGLWGRRTQTAAPRRGPPSRIGVGGTRGSERDVGRTAEPE